jgi:hypothetical protein
MIVAAALCPAPPLLVRELTGAALVAADLRTACLEAVAELRAADPEVIAVAGPAGQTTTWDGTSSLDLALFAPRARARSRTDRSPGLPPALGVGAWLLDQAGYTGERILQSLAADEPGGRCAGLGTSLAGSRERVSLLVMADGSARRGLKAPGYLDQRSASFDADVERAVRTGRLDPLLSIDEDLARELMATGRPAWQVLAGAVAGRRVTSEIRYVGDPFGVAYLVASLRVPPVQP